MTQNKFNRRDFIKLSAVGLAAAAGTRLLTQEASASEGAKGEHQWVMVIDQSKCYCYKFFSPRCVLSNLVK